MDMKKYISDCNGCPECVGCSLGEKTLHVFCDKCGGDGQIYFFDGRELCIDCIEKELTPVTEEGAWD